MQTPNTTPEFETLVAALAGLDERIRARIATAKPEDAPSYTRTLIESGTAQIAKKVGEEAIEVAIAAVRSDSSNLVEETVDLLYHLLVLMRACDVCPSALAREIEARAGHATPNNAQ